MFTVLQGVGGAADAVGPAVQAIGINHGPLDVAAAEQLLIMLLSWPRSSSWVANDWREQWDLVVAQLGAPVDMADAVERGRIGDQVVVHDHQLVAARRAGRGELSGSGPGDCA